jgi:anaerobic selenocysteine-containing dehydrogenase
MGEKRVVRSTCKGCHGGCGVLVTVENDRITYIEGDPDSNTKGTMCGKGLAAIQHMDHPDRLSYPMKRTVQRGEGKWTRIGWGEALETITGKMRELRDKYGANAIINSQGTGRGYNRYTVRLGNSIGTGNRGLGTSHICYFPRLKAFEATFGFNRLYCDYHGWGGEFPKTHISWGKQIEVSNSDGEMAVWFFDALKHAKNLILVDPRATSIANRANLWLRIRPGTDAALALGMMHVIINEELYDKDFVSDWTHGFDELKERVQEYPPAKVSEITWIPKEKIIQAARMFALDTPGVIQTGEALDASNNSTGNARAIFCLMAITGNVERPGGMVNWVHPATGPMLAFAFEIADNIPQENRDRAIGADKHRYMDFGRCHTETVLKQLREGQCDVKMLHQHGGNFLFSLANTHNVRKALLNLEFISVADHFMSAMAEIADIVLPVAHWLEEDDLWNTHPGFITRAVNKVVEPPGEAWSTPKIYYEIGKRIAPKFWPWKNLEEMLDYQLRKAKLTWKEFSKMGELATTGKDQKYYKYQTDYWVKGGGFPTPTGKVELYSTVLEKLDYDPLPAHIEPSESYYSTPEVAKKYPLLLSTGGRIPWYFHTQYANLPWIRELQPHPRVQIHPDTAKEHGVEEEDWIWIETKRGRIKQKANLFSGMDPRLVVVQASFCYWEKKGAQRVLPSNANVLTSDEGPFDGPAGSVNMRALLCKIYKVREGDSQEFQFS